MKIKNRKWQFLLMLFLVVAIFITGCSKGTSEEGTTNDSKEYVIVECPSEGVEAYFGVRPEGQTSVSFPQVTSQDIVISYAQVEGRQIIWHGENPFIFVFDDSKNPLLFGQVFYSDSYKKPISLKEFEEKYWNEVL